MSLRRDPNGSALSNIPQSVSRGARISRLPGSLALRPVRLLAPFDGSDQVSPAPRACTLRLPAACSPLPPLSISTTGSGLLLLAGLPPAGMTASLASFAAPDPMARFPFRKRCALGFAPAGARRHTRGPGFVDRSPQTGFIGGDDRTSQVPGGPHYERAVLFDPGGILKLGHCRASVLSSTFSTVSASATIVISGLNRTAHASAVYASQDELLHRHARLASGWLASLSGRDWHPLGPNERFQVILPPFPGFAWRTGNDRVKKR
jgi:hypothetical protein